MTSFYKCAHRLTSETPATAPVELSVDPCWASSSNWARHTGGELVDEGERLWLRHCDFWLLRRLIRQGADCAVERGRRTAGALTEVDKGLVSRDFRFETTELVVSLTSGLAAQQKGQWGADCKLWRSSEVVEDVQVECSGMFSAVARSIANRQPIIQGLHVKWFVTKPSPISGLA